MDLKDCILIKTIAEEKSITKAADRLYTVQPSLTYRLKNIEKEFATEIFLRTPSGVIPTPEGEYLLSYAEETINRFNQVKEHIQNMSNTVRGTLRLGASAVIAHYELPKILKQYLQMYPEVGISLKTGMSQKIIRMLQKAELSAAVIRGDFTWTDEKHLLRDEPICIVSAQPLAFSDLPNHPRIVAQTDGPLQTMFEKWWRENFKVPPKVTMELDNMETCRQMVSHGLGWAILPSIGISHHNILYTKPLYWKNGQPLTRSTWLLYTKESTDLSAVRTFTEYIKSHF